MSLAYRACYVAFAAAGIVGFACSSPPSDCPGAPAADASTGDAADATTMDAAPPADAGDAGQDAAPIVTSTLGATGTIEFSPSSLVAYFRYDDTIVRTSEEPGCVLFVRTAFKPFANAGDLSVGGDFVGTDGGLATPGSYSAATDNSYEVFLPPGTSFFPESPVMRLQLEKADYDAFPAIPLTTLRTATTAPQLKVKTPVVPDAGALALSAAKGLAITWDVPAVGDAGALPAARVAVTLKGLATTSREADLRCGFPAAAGSAVLPASLFREIRARLLPGGVGSAITGGFLSIGFGDQREVRSGEASYVIQVTTVTSSSFPDVEATLGD